MSTTRIRSAASPMTLHRLLADTAAWPVWSPHVAAVHSSQRVVSAGWRGAVRAFFSPVPTEMLATWAVEGEGYDWETTLGPWRLRYRNRIAGPATADGRTTLCWSADLEGPGAATLARLLGPLSAFGQRRRMTRLARTAELVEAHAAL